MNLILHRILLWTQDNNQADDDDYDEADSCTDSRNLH